MIVDKLCSPVNDAGASNSILSAGDSRKSVSASTDRSISPCTSTATSTTPRAHDFAPLPTNQRPLSPTPIWPSEAACSNPNVSNGNDSDVRPSSCATAKSDSTDTSSVVVARCARGNLHTVTAFGRPVSGVLSSSTAVSPVPALKKPDREDAHEHDCIVQGKVHSVSEAKSTAVKQRVSSGSGGGGTQRVSGVAGNSKQSPSLVVVDGTRSCSTPSQVPLNPPASKIYHYKSLAQSKAQLDQEVRDLREVFTQVINSTSFLEDAGSYHASRTPTADILCDSDASTTYVSALSPTSVDGEQAASVNRTGGALVAVAAQHKPHGPISLSLDKHARTRIADLEKQSREEAQKLEGLIYELKREQQLVLELQSRVQQHSDCEQRFLSLRCEEAALRENILKTQGVLGVPEEDIPHTNRTEILGLRADIEALITLHEARRAEAAVRRLERDLLVEQSKLDSIQRELQRQQKSNPGTTDSALQSQRSVGRGTQRAGSLSQSEQIAQQHSPEELLLQISRLEEEISLSSEELAEAHEQQRAQKEKLENARRQYDNEEQAYTRECNANQEIIRCIAATEDDIIILRQQLNNLLRTLMLAIHSDSGVKKDTTRATDCRLRHASRFNKVAIRIQEALEVVTSIQDETSNMIEDATLRGIATTARGPFGGHKDKIGMRVAQYEKDVAHLRALIKALELRREELHREYGVKEPVPSTTGALRRNVDPPQVKKYVRSKSFGAA